MSGKENRDQIPTKSNEEQTKDMIQRQQEIPGESREKSVSNFPKAAELGQALKEMNFPADKNAILKFVEQSTRQESRDVLPLVQRIKDRSYNSVSDVAEAARLVS